MNKKNKGIVHFLAVGLIISMLVGCSDMESSNSTPEVGDNEALYTMTITNLFTGEVPSGAHFTPLTGMVHKTAHSLWQVGQAASAGVIDVAEKGNNSALLSEISTHINSAEALSRSFESSSVFHPDSNSSDVQTVTDILVSATYNRVSLVSMIGPSPDWFVGIDSFVLHENSEFKETATVNLYGYDAGTQDGTTFALQFSNSGTDSSPTQSIRTLSDNTTVNHPVILGTIVFTKQ